MHMQSTTLAHPPESAAARPSRLVNPVTARSPRPAKSTYRAPSVVLLRPGPMRKLAWIFGVR